MVIINASTMISGAAKKDPIIRAPPSTMSDRMPKSLRDLRMAGRARWELGSWMDDGGISIIRAPASSSAFFRSVFPSEWPVVPS